MKEPIYVGFLKHPFAKKETLPLEDIRHTPMMMRPKNNAFRHTLSKY